MTKYGEDFNEAAADREAFRGPVYQDTSEWPDESEKAPSKQDKAALKPIMERKGRKRS